MTSANPRARHQVVGIVAVTLFAALFSRLWYLQVLTTDEYELAARSGRTRSVILESPRGRILDRHGKVLVDNRRTIQVQVDYQDFHRLDEPAQDELLRRLATALSADEMLRCAGERTVDDPGPRGDNTPATIPAPQGDEPGDEGDLPDDEGNLADDPTTTTTTTAPEDPATDGPPPAICTGADPAAEANPPAGEGEAGEEGEPGDEPALDDPATPEDESQEPSEPTFGQPRQSAGVATGAANPDGEGVAQPNAPVAFTAELLRERIEDPRSSKLKPVPVATGVSEELEIQLSENIQQFPTVHVERVTVRSYRYGALAAHVLGYVGLINGDEFEEYQNDEKPYENDDEIGKVGIERSMERELRGTPGRVEYEVDARGNPTREVERTEPKPGRDVYLTLDINLQYLAEKQLATEIARRQDAISRGCTNTPKNNPRCTPDAGAAVAVDPSTGGVLAMASYPTYDPNLFVGGISTRDYEAISLKSREDEHHFPLLNRTIGGAYPPGSTFKLFSAYAALVNGIVSFDEWYSDTTGRYAYSPDCDITKPPAETNCYQQNAGAAPSGDVDLRLALTDSSDTYFYRIGDLSWRRRAAIGDTAMQEQMKAWGLGERTGLGLPGELPGRIPTPDWLREFSNNLNKNNPELAKEAGTWKAGTSGNTMVGQGDVTMTPLQMAQGYATLANGGTIYRPQLVIATAEYGGTAQEPRLIERVGEVPMFEEWRQAFNDGFSGVTKTGTAATLFSGLDQSGFDVAGKTGTSQTNNKNDTSLFVGYAPSDSATISMAAVIEFGGFGGEAAGPVVYRVFDALSQFGGDLKAMNDSGLYEAPPLGRFDVEAEMQLWAPPVNAAAFD